MPVLMPRGNKVRATPKSRAKNAPRHSVDWSAYHPRQGHRCWAYVMRIFLIITSAGIAFAWPGVAAASFCATGRPSLQSEYAGAKYVMVGTATRVAESKKRRYYYRNSWHTSVGRVEYIRLVEALKGSPPPRIRYFDEYSSAQFLMTTGAKYLIFFTVREFDGELIIDTCGHSGSMRRVGASTVTRIREMRRSSTTR